MGLDPYIIEGIIAYEHDTECKSVVITNISSVDGAYYRQYCVKGSQVEMVERWLNALKDRGAAG